MLPSNPEALSVGPCSLPCVGALRGHTRLPLSPFSPLLLQPEGPREKTHGHPGFPLMGCRLPHLHLPHPYKQALGSPASSAVCGGGALWDSRPGARRAELASPPPSGCSSQGLGAGRGLGRGSSGSASRTSQPWGRCSGRKGCQSWGWGCESGSCLGERWTPGRTG